MSGVLAVNELSSPVSPSDSADIRLLFTTRVVRLFAYGFLSVMLVLYLAEVGFSEENIGLLLGMTLIGDTGISLWITTRADKIGRKRMLIAGAALMLLGGLVFALTSNFWLMLLAATVGVLSPSGNEIGPFLAIEQAALAQLVSAGQRTRIIAWYNLAGSFATATGALVCGVLVQVLEAHGARPLLSYRVILFGYAAAGMLLAALFLRLSPASEAVPVNRAPAPREGLIRRDSFGLHRSRGVVIKLSGLFALDSRRRLCLTKFRGLLVPRSIWPIWRRSAAFSSVPIFWPAFSPGGNSNRQAWIAEYDGVHPCPFKLSADCCSVHADHGPGHSGFVVAIRHLADGCAGPTILYCGYREP